jgi:hypothetical protein
VPPWLNKIALVAACLAIPILWGWLVNLLFVRWSRRRGSEPTRRDNTPPEQAGEQTFSDYQI